MKPMPTSNHSQAIVMSLSLTVTRTLERKRALGQYAVIWENGSPRLEGPDAPMPPLLVAAPPESPRHSGA